MLKRFTVLIISLALVSTFAIAQSDLDDSLFGENSSEESTDDSLFGGSNDVFGDSIFTEIEEDPNANPADALLTNEAVVIGGNFGVSAQINLGLNAKDNEDAFTSGLSDLSTRLFLDARPTPDFRAFAKGDISYDSSDGVSFDLREAFADIAIEDTVFLRAGKQTINWGVGLFFSPANLVNIENIDPENTGAELAGPVAIKAQVPIGNNNFSGYALLNTIDSGTDIGLAARYEFLVENYELTVGGVIRNEAPWAIMTTATGAIEDITVFAELVLEGNTDKTFIIKDDTSPLGYSASSSDDLYASATLGARASYTTENDLYSVAGVVQYFFNGLGYEDSSVFTEKPQVVGALLGQGQLSFSDLMERGQHYAAISINSQDLANSGFTPSLLWLGNLSDGSGIISASVNYTDIEYFTPSLSYRYNYGNEGAEYSPQGGKHSLTLALDISGSF